MRLLVLAVAILSGFSFGDRVSPSGNEWQSPGELSLNKELPHAWFFSFTDVESARKVLPERVEYWAEKIGVSYGRISIRLQSSRWGSCAQNGNLNFNCLLVLMPPEILDSVVVHERCHRKFMNHSKDFYAEINRVFPDYERCNKWLKENGGAFMKRIINNM